MTNTSATGGALAPSDNPGPLEGAELNAFLQAWMVSICGLDGKMVRPRWQAEPANIPIAGEAWMAFGITDRDADKFPEVIHNIDGEGTDKLKRNQQLDVLCSFYDLGTNGLADRYSSLLRDGVIIEQNRAPLYQGGFGLVETIGPTTVPSLHKQRWLYRCDLHVVLKRMVVRHYPVLTILSSSGTIEAEEVTVTFNVAP